MAKCRACLHYEMCAVRHKDDDSLCCYFKDRSRYVVREKGEWEIIRDDYDNELMRCPFCREEFYDGENDTVDHTPNFCPNCGADMTGGGRTDEA